MIHPKHLHFLAKNITIIDKYYLFLNIFSKYKEIMDYFFEKQNIKDVIIGTRSENAFTLVYIISGNVQLTFLNESYALYPQQASLIFPNIPYSLYTFDNSEIILLRFSSNFIPEATARVSGKLPSNPIFDGQDIFDNISFIENNDDILLIKAYIYEILYSYFSSNQLINADLSKYAFITDATKYISENFDKNISLQSLAKYLQYDYNYTSRLFKTSFKMPFPTLLNEYRIKKAQNELIEHSDKSILEIAMDCGYSSLRSFNRNFLEISGMTPKEFRQQNR